LIFGIVFEIIFVSKIRIGKQDRETNHHWPNMETLRVVAFFRYGFPKTWITFCDLRSNRFKPHFAFIHSTRIWEIIVFESLNKSNGLQRTRFSKSEATSFFFFFFFSLVFFLLFLAMPFITIYVVQAIVNPRHSFTTKRLRPLRKSNCVSFANETRKSNAPNVHQAHDKRVRANAHERCWHVRPGPRITIVM
jgi:hypothetical protein